MMDETPIQVLKEEGRRAQSKSYFWLIHTGEDGLNPIILYNYTPTIEAESRKIGDYRELDVIAPIISGVANGYGVSIEGKLNNKVSLKSKNVLSTIELFEGNKPFNQRGYGSKKLINLGLQVGNSDKASILLIDEIEIGLEPYRQKNLLHRLKKEVEKIGQVIFTTHSTVVLAELDISQLILVNSLDGITSFQVIANGDAVLNSIFRNM